MKLRKIVKDLAVPLINAVRALWAARGAILHPNNPSMSRLLIPTRRPQGPSPGAAPNHSIDKQNHSIDKYTVAMEPPTNRSKRKHTSQSSDPPSKTKAAAQLYLTAYTSCPGQQKPSTVLSSTFLISERPTPPRTLSRKSLICSPILKISHRDR
jgi:hypothetical protein